MKKRNITSLFKKLGIKLTFFDYLSLLLAASAVLFLLLFLLRRWEYVNAEVKVSNAPYWLADDLRAGDCSLDGLGRKMVEIVKVKAFETRDETKTVYLNLSFRVIKDKRKNQYIFEDKPLTVGQRIKLDFPRSSFLGLVTYVEGVEDKRNWGEKVVKTRLLERSETFPETLGVMPWVAEVIEEGQTMKNGRGEVVAEVIDKIVVPADKIVVTDAGKVFVAQDPIKKDVFLTFRIKTFNQEGVDYFLEDIKVKNNKSIFIALPTIDIWPVVTEVVK